MLNKTYPFKEDFVKKILAIMAKDRQFTAQYRDVLDDCFFGGAVHQKLASIVLGYYDKYKDVPTRATFFEILREYLETIKPENASTYQVMACEIHDDSSLRADSSFVRDKVVEFGIREKLGNRLINVVKALDDGVKPPLELQKELGKLSRIGHGESDLGQFYYKGRVSRLSFEDQDDNFYPMGIGIPAIDNYMEGGIQPGEILGIFGAYNTFKSGFFVNVAAYQFAMQRNGVVYSLEMPEKRYSARVDARLTQYTLSELKRGGRFGTLALRALDKFRGTQADIMVKSFPTRKATLSMIRAHIEALSEAQGFVPEYVIIDYLALLKSESPDKKDYLQLAELIYDFRGMAGEFGFRGFTGGQLGRTDGRDARSDGTKVAGSIEMMNAPDVGILIQQTEEQKRNGEIDLKMERCRNSASGAIFRTTVHTDTMTLGMDAFEVLPDGTPVVKNNSMDHS